MSQWVVVYAKVKEDKKKGVKVMGPYAGPICETEDDAKQASRRLVNDARSNESMIPKIYEMPPESSYELIFDQARPYFDRLKGNIISAKKIMDKPPRKKRKKRK